MYSRKFKIQLLTLEINIIKFKILTSFFNNKPSNFWIIVAPLFCPMYLEIWL